jgi:hypothetical protein
VLRALVIASLLAGCTRDAIDTCPDLGVAELVVTEVRGDEDPVSGSWIEVFNASGRSLELEGVRIRFQKVDGSVVVPVLTRRPLSIADGEYLVLGKYLDNDRPPHVDYGFVDDFVNSSGTDVAWLDGAAIFIESCGEVVDLAQYSALPTVGTFSLGTLPPTAEANDLATAWCTDSTPTGTPGAANTPCP